MFDAEKMEVPSSLILGWHCTLSFLISREQRMELRLERLWILPPNNLRERSTILTIGRIYLRFPGKMEEELRVEGRLSYRSGYVN